MNRTFFFCLIFILFFSSFNGVAQQNHLTFGINGVVHEDSLSIGDTIHFNFWIVNQSVVPLTDSVSIHCEPFDDLGSSISAMSIGSFYNTLGFLSPGDSLFVTISEIVTYQSYVLGDNIVVIWPASIGGGTVDTSVTSVYIYDSLSTKLDIPHSDIQCFPNPIVNDVVFFDSSVPISFIRVVNNLGEIIYLLEDIDLLSSSIPLYGFNTGVYYIEFFSEKSRFISKVILK